MTPEQMAAAQAMMTAGTPGQEHSRLASMAGSWTFTGTFWMGPEGPTSTTTGTAERSMILDGRILFEKISSSIEGVPFEGHGMTGYDNAAKTYWSTWVDSMTTGIMTSTGRCESGRCEFRGSSTDPMTGQPAPNRFVSEHGADREVHTAFSPGPDGKEWKMMELVYTRKK